MWFAVRRRETTGGDRGWTVVTVRNSRPDPNRPLRTENPVSLVHLSTCLRTGSRFPPNRVSSGQWSPVEWGGTSLLGTDVPQCPGSSPDSSQVLSTLVFATPGPLSYDSQEWCN